MDNRLTSALFGHYHFSQAQVRTEQNAARNAASDQKLKSPVKSPPQDIVSLSPAHISENNAPLQNQTRLLHEVREQTENGFRRTQEFQNAKGQNLTRIEEVISSTNRTRRTIIQQNPSGSTTRLENIFDRQENGNFRLTKRLTNEAGEVQTNIEFDLPPPSLDIALGRVNQVDTALSDQPSPDRGQALNIVV
ncbi:MAG: hypothetical protein MRY79_07895 [Alphaproteobacteria bacterium]|nr:hypothetical protein [Alphaproteobacteria bacterium]